MSRLRLGRSRICMSEPLERAGLLPATTDEPEEPSVSLNGELSDQVAAVALRLSETLLRQILEESVAAAGAKRAALLFIHHLRRELTVVLAAGEEWTPEALSSRIPILPVERQSITAYVAATGQPYRTGDVSRDHRYRMIFEDVVSELALPVVDSHGRVVGVLDVDSPRRDAFGEQEQAILMPFAEKAATVWDLAMHQARERALLAISRDLSALTDPKDIMRKAVDIGAHILRADDCSLFLLEPDGKTLSFLASHRPPQPGGPAPTYQLGEGLTGWVAEHREPVRTGDPRRDPRWRGVVSEFPPEEIEAYLGVPVLGRDGCLGVLRVVRRRWPSVDFRNRFSPHEQGILVTLASHLGVALDNARLVERLMITERMAAWGDMSARAAHMLGNTVFALKGHLNELEYVTAVEGAHADSARDLLGQLRSGITRLEEILQEFKEFVMTSRLTPSEHALDPLLEALMKEVFPRGTKVTLKIVPNAPGAYVQVDVNKLRRCLNELAENAVHVQPEGGSVTVSTSIASADEAAALGLASRSQGWARIDVTDEGPGIAREHRGKMFTPFFTTRSQGMGLGLSIVKGIIDSHGGLITEIGAPGHGAHFVIALPISRMGEPPPAQHPLAEEG